MDTTIGGLGEMHGKGFSSDPPRQTRREVAEPTGLPDLTELRPVVLRWARGLSGDADAAEDLTQETLIRVASAERPPHGSAEPWVYRILVNLHTDRERTRSRRLRLLDRGRERVPRPSGDTTDPAEAVAAFLEDLSDQQRAVFQLVDLEGWASSAVADALDLTESTVRVHLHRARRKIRERILETPA